jgi:hypothetical protein
LGGVKGCGGEGKGFDSRRVALGYRPETGEGTELFNGLLGNVIMSIPPACAARVFLAVALFALNVCVVSATSASEVPTNLWSFAYHVEEGGELTMSAVMLASNVTSPELIARVEAAAAASDWQPDLTAPARLKFHTPANGRVGMKYTAGYYRGPIYGAPGAVSPFGGANAKDTNYVSIFSSRATSKLIAAVDHGFVYTSADFGMTWEVITEPGPHEFPLDPAPDGSGFCAHASVEPLGSAAYAAGGTKAPLAEWYAVASSRDGSELVVSASVSQPAPALSIRHSAAGVTIAWPTEFTGFTLEHAASLSEGLWTSVTNSVQVVARENRVVVSPAVRSHFFRLRGH